MNRKIVVNKRERIHEEEIINKQVNKDMQFLSTVIH
jgi:hypothetical protein